MPMKYKLETTKRARCKALAARRRQALRAADRSGARPCSWWPLPPCWSAPALRWSAPVIIGRAIDTYVRLKDSRGLLLSSVWLLAVYLIGVAASYTQIRTMGGVGRRVLFSLRNELFAKLQDLPLAFFTENKAGDLISRVNNDTDKLNQFVAQALMQFVSSIFLMTGVGCLCPLAQLPPGNRGPSARLRRVRGHQGHRRVGEAPEHAEPADPRRTELRGAGKPA